MRSELHKVDEVDAWGEARVRGIQRNRSYSWRQIPSYPSICCLNQKSPFIFSHERIELKIYPAETPYIYQTTLTINSLWEVKNTDGDVTFTQ